MIVAGLLRPKVVQNKTMLRATCNKTWARAVLVGAASGKRVTRRSPFLVQWHPQSLLRLSKSTMRWKMT